eukprot:4776656-Amphidinium_carterae.1
MFVFWGVVFWNSTEPAVAACRNEIVHSVLGGVVHQLPLFFLAVVHEAAILGYPHFPLKPIVLLHPRTLTDADD